jgi:7-cyano-7-deazaguanine reductase
MSTPEQSSLGRASAYPEAIDPALLFAIARSGQREALAMPDPPPFRGVDVWTCWELTWLRPDGRPQVAVAQLAVPADSPAIVESKSLKLYLGGYAQVRFDDPAAVAARIGAEVGACAGAPVAVRLRVGAEVETLLPAPFAHGESIDEVETTIEHVDGPAPALLATGAGRVAERLTSRLFRSACPVTGQPDFADIAIDYAGAPLDRAGLLRYLVSYRRHRGFHEQCVERLFLDIKARCAPDRLTVQGRFTRRGGLDISPWRSDDPDAVAPAWQRAARQ